VQLGNVTGPGAITVAVAQYSNYDNARVPQTITEVPLETVAVPSGGSQTIDVPTSALAPYTAQAGVFNLQLTATFGNEVSVTAAPLSVSPASTGSATAARDLVAHLRVRFTRFHRLPHLVAGEGHAAAGGGCVWQGTGTETEQSARIGELHVANLSGASATYNYSQQADSTFGVEYSDSGPTSGYSESGTASVGNSWGTNASLYGGQGYLWYIDSHFYSETYRSNYSTTGTWACGSEYMTQVVSAVGDVYQGTNQPPVNPYGSCTSDPYGYATVPPRGQWSSDRGQAQSYSVSLSIFGVGLYGDTGFNSNINITYHNASSSDQYVCGTTYMPDVPVLYES
jgi:hypothetical protein